MFDTIVLKGEKIRIKINTAQIEVMKISTLDTRCVSIGNSNLKEVNSFVYLGSCMNNDGDIKAEINIRIGKSSYVFNCLKNVWKEDRISVAIKMKLFNAIVIPVL